MGTIIGVQTGLSTRWRFDDGLGPFAGTPARRWSAGPVGALILLALCAVVYLPGLLTIPPVDRDEARFAQASRQMFESVALPKDQLEPERHAGGLLIPRVQSRDRLNKPPLTYWAQAASAAVLTRGDPLQDNIWMYRLPSALAAVASVLFLWRLGCSMFAPQPAFLAAAFLAVCPMVVWDAHQARADQLLLAATTLAMLALWRIYATRAQTPRPFATWAWPVTFWVALALGVLTKGPITPLVGALTLLWLCYTTRQWRWLARLRPLTGLAICLALVLPWFIAVAARVGFADYARLALDETLGRSATAKESHWGPPGYHLVLSAVLLWPGSLLTAFAFARTWRLGLVLPPRDKPGYAAFVRTLPSRWRRRAPGTDDAAFCLAWVIPAWIVFELISTKLPHYVLPLYPALCLISAKALWDVVNGGRLPVTTGLRLGFGIWLAIGVAIAVVAPVAVALLAGAGWPPMVLAAMTATFAAVLLWQARTQLDRLQFLPAQLLAVGVACVFAVGFLGFVLPAARTLFISPRLLTHAAWSPGVPVASVGYHEDSLVFLTRGQLVRLDTEAEAERWLRRNRAGILFAPADLTLDPLLTQRRGDVHGFNYAAGRFDSIAVTERAR